MKKITPKASAFGVRIKITKSSARFHPSVLLIEILCNLISGGTRFLSLTVLTAYDTDLLQECGKQTCPYVN